MADWYTAVDGTAQTRLVAAWADAPVQNEELCGFIVDTARLQVLEFAPTADTVQAALAGVLLQFGLTDRLEEVLDVLGVVEDTPPFNWVLAQLQQCKNLWAAGRADESGNIGTEGYSFVPRPLDKTIRTMIRPTQGDINAL